MSKRQLKRAAAPTGAHYPIRAVSRLTGLGIDTLRAWERRHQAVTPQRDERGRMYTDADIDRFRLLRSAVEAGHSIGRIASMDADTLQRLAGADAAVVAQQRASSLPPVRVDRNLRTPFDDQAGLLAAVRAFDRDRLESDLGRAAALLPPLEFLEGVLAPLMRRVGDEWHGGTLSIAQEHFASGVVRGVLSALLRSQPRHAESQLLFATPPGEWHEFGILGAALLAASRGLGALYLGPDLPAADIIASAESAGVRVVVIGMTMFSPKTPATTAVATLSRQLPSRVELWIGGQAAPQSAASGGRRAVVVPTFSVLERELERVASTSFRA